MSHNVGILYVDAGAGMGQADVTRAISAYRKVRGGRAARRSPLDIEPMPLEDSDDHGRLGYAVSPAKDGWFAVLDTEQVSADFGLAEHLQASLGVRVVWATLWGATNAGAIRLLGPWKRKAPRDTYDAVWSFTSALSGWGLLGFSELSTAKARKGFALMGFDRVPVASYAFGPPDPVEAKKKKKKKKKKESEPKAAPCPMIATLGCIMHA